MIRANGEDTAILDRNRFGNKHVRIHRENVAALVYMVCMGHFTILCRFVT